MRCVAEFTARWCVEEDDRMRGILRLSLMSWTTVYIQLPTVVLLHISVEVMNSA